MTLTLVDKKLIELVKTCNKTHDYKKLAVVLMSLINNELHVIAIHLGLRPRKKEVNEKLHEYMNFIDQFVNHAFHFHLFKDLTVEILRGIELEFLRKEGYLSKDYLKFLINLYYELRKIEIPDITSEFREDLYWNLTPFQAFHEVSSNLKTATPKKDYINSMLLTRLNSEEKRLEHRLEQHYNPIDFEQLLHVKALKVNLKKGKNSKIKLKGKLKDSIAYSYLMHDLVGYFFLGIVIVGMCLGLLLLLEIIFVNLGLYLISVPEEYTYLFMVFFGVGLIFLYFYNKFFFRLSNYKN